MEIQIQSTTQPQKKRISGIALLFCLIPLIASASPQIEAIQSMLQAKSTAWARGDADAWGKDYSEDSVLINIYGSRFGGRKTNVERHAKVFEEALSDTSLTIEFERVELLGEDLALAETMLTVKSNESSTGGVSEADLDELKTRMSFILEHGAETGWQIIFAQNTSVSP